MKINRNHKRSEIIEATSNNDHDSNSFKIDSNIENAIWRIGKICPRCVKQLVLKPNMFYWRGKHFSGWVCEKCNALFENEDDSMFDYILNG